MTTFEELKAKRPADRGLVEHYKRLMLDEVRTYRLRDSNESRESREFREQPDSSLSSAPPAGRRSAR